MRATLSFLTTTTSTAAEWPTAAAGHALEVLGWDPGTRRVFVVDRGGGAPSLQVIASAGAHAGVALPLPGDAERIEQIRRGLVPLEPRPLDGWELGTRVVQRRGLKIGGMATPVRKFALGMLVTERHEGVPIGSGRVTVTAFLRPRATLSAVWAVRGEAIAVAVVSYCGVPAGIGFDKQTAILATPTLQ